MSRLVKVMERFLGLHEMPQKSYCSGVHVSCSVVRRGGARELALSVAHGWLSAVRPRCMKGINN